MYTLSVGKDFIARHFLIGGDWGKENKPHAHHYSIEVRCSGETLDDHGYLVDITVMEAFLDEVVGRHKDCMLNYLPEFSGLNPSIEHFARIICEDLAARLGRTTLESIAVRISENNTAWASCTRRF